MWRAWRSNDLPIFDDWQTEDGRVGHISAMVLEFVAFMDKPGSLLMDHVLYHFFVFNHEGPERADCYDPRGICHPSPSLCGTHAIVLVL